MRVYLKKCIYVYIFFSLVGINGYFVRLYIIAIHYIPLFCFRTALIAFVHGRGSCPLLLLVCFSKYRSITFVLQLLLITAISFCVSYFIERLIGSAGGGLLLLVVI